MDELTEDLILDLGGWDARYVLVLAKAVVEGGTVAILDTNGGDGGRSYEYSEAYEWSDADGHSRSPA